MKKRELYHKIIAHEFGYKFNCPDQCEKIIEELERERYSDLARLLSDCEWKAACEWVENNV